MRLIALIAVLLIAAAAATGSFAQAVVPPEGAVNVDPAPADNLESLDDILARQRGEGDDRAPRDFDSAAGNATALSSQLGPQGGASDADYWNAVRFGTAGDVSVSSHGPAASVLVQDGGMWWLNFRDGPLREYGGWLLIGTIALLALFFLLRGRIRIDRGRAGWTIPRFDFIERVAHWTLAGSFLLLALTGLLLLFGRAFLIPVFGLQAYSIAAQGSKWVHNNVSWAFMLALVLVFVFWVAHNLPSRTDLIWLRRAGGMLGGAHPPAKKFNLGQKLIFWSVIVFGASISASGLSLLFPFELPMFAKTFAIFNDLGIPGLIGQEPFPAQLAPQEEMQYAQIWHTIIGFLLMSIVIAHIYIGTIGMEGAFEAMGSGEVDANWAREHHSIWAEKKLAEQGVYDRPSSPPTPAE